MRHLGYLSSSVTVLESLHGRPPLWGGVLKAGLRPKPYQLISAADKPENVAAKFKHMFCRKIHYIFTNSFL